MDKTSQMRPEKDLQISSPMKQGDFLLHFKKATHTPGDEYWVGGIVTLHDVEMTSPSNPDLHELRDRYWLSAKWVFENLPKSSS